MTKKVFLHVGVPKSGTTYIQAVLASNKNRLIERAQVLYPGRRWRDQVMAVRDLRSGAGHDVEAQGAWARLVKEIKAFDGDAVVSMEWLGGITTEEGRRIVETLAPSQVEVILTVRDLARTIPAAWQEFLQNFEVWSWPEFLGAVTSENPRATPAGNAFWAQQDLGKILAIWRDSVPSEHLHVVTLPQSGAPAGVLWSRFSSVLGIDGSIFDASGKGSNESLGRESAEMMLRLNLVSRAQGVDPKTYDEMFKHALAKRGLSNRKHVETPQYRLPPELEEWARARTSEQVRAIQGSGATVVGDLTELEPKFARPGADEAKATVDGILDAALAGLVALAKDRGGELDKLRQRNTQLERRNLHLRKPQSPDELPRPIRKVYRFVMARWRRATGRG